MEPTYYWDALTDDTLGWINTYFARPADSLFGGDSPVFLLEQLRATEAKSLVLSISWQHRQVHRSESFLDLVRVRPPLD